ncbi:MAG: MBL fold metallo-hydrolase [Mogibacterium sp.]|nr:MBL fold metallo-hydrolase [Mogibacterium sp.]
MNDSDRNSGKREVKPLGVFALIMGIIYSIPIVMMFFIHNNLMITLGLAAIPITAISFMTAKTNFWKAPATNVRVSYFGHMCFKLECDEQTVILDPYPAGSVPGLKPVKGKANAVLYTGEEKGGEAIRIVKAKKPLPFNVTEYEAADGNSKMLMLDNGTHRIVDLGSLKCDLTEEQLETFRHADILLVPIGGKYTIDEDKAAEIALAIEPEYIIPMAFRAQNYGLPDISTGPMFLSNIRTGWIKQEGNEDRRCPATIRLAARNGKEKGLSSVEIRSREDIEKERAKKKRR